jgi:hypothetical protein
MSTDASIIGVEKGQYNVPTKEAGKYVTVHWETEVGQLTDLTGISHNGIYRGKDLTNYYASGEMSKAIANGSFKDIYIGDYITKNIVVGGTTYQVKWEVADIDYFYKSGDASCDTHHVVLLPSKAVFVNIKMNDTDTTKGGYAGSKMWKETIPAVVTGIKAAFGADHVVKHRELLTIKVSATAQSVAGAGWTGSSTGQAWADVEANIPTEPMVYGGTVFGSSGYDVGSGGKQFAIFRFKKGCYPDRMWFWLRAVASASGFCSVGDDGLANYLDASRSASSGGCRPYFLFR